jgi:hypothetical protein
MKKSIFLFLVIVALTVISCEYNDLSPTPADGDYLPVNHENRYFLREQFSQPDLSDRYYYDTMWVRFMGDTLIGNKTYHRINHFSMWDSGSGWVVSSDFYRFYRREGSQYFQLTWGDFHEEVFLDTEKPVGTTWSYEQGFEGEWRTTYTIKAVNAVRIVNGKAFQNVIEVESEAWTKDHNGHEYLVTRQLRYFARDKGEILSLFKSFTYTSALRLTALE